MPRLTASSDALEDVVEEPADAVVEASLDAMEDALDAPPDVSEPDAPDPKTVQRRVNRPGLDVRHRWNMHDRLHGSRFM